MRANPALLALFLAVTFGAASAASADRSLPAITITAISTDSTYGTEPNPIKTGGGLDGVSREDQYLALLRGPHGEALTIKREGSCCSFKTPNGLIGGMGLLDVYVVTIGNGGPTRKLYVDMYDYDTPKAPMGFTFEAATP